MTMQWKDLSRKYTNNIDVEKKKSPFELLGVEKNVSEKELRKAYLNKVKVYHPDCADPFLHKYNQEMLKLINLAYEKINKGNL